MHFVCGWIVPVAAAPVAATAVSDGSAASALQLESVPRELFWQGDFLRSGLDSSALHSNPPAWIVSADIARTHTVPFRQFVHEYDSVAFIDSFCGGQPAPDGPVAGGRTESLAAFCRMGFILGAKGPPFHRFEPGSTAALQFAKKVQQQRPFEVDDRDRAQPRLNDTQLSAFFARSQGLFVVS
jgi:hypothetical protein